MPFIFLLAVLLMSVSARAQSIEILGEFISPQALSEDGSVVVGRGPNDEAIRWEDGEITVISPVSTANDISPDGLIVVGSIGETPGREGYRWVNGALTVLTAPTGPRDVIPLAVNQDGTVIGGRAIFESQLNPQSSVALRWQGVSWSILPDDFTHGGVDDIDNSGAIAVGLVSQTFLGESEAALWQNGVLSVIGPGGNGSSQTSRATCISGDGTKVIINIRETLASPRDTFQIYTVATETKSDPIPGFATSINTNGTVIVGYDEFFDPFIWTQEGGLRDLQEFLANDLNYDLEGWESFGSSVAVSGNGKFLVGGGIDPESRFVGWRVDLDPEIEIIVNSIADRGLDPDSRGCDTGEETDSGDPECTLRSAIEAVNLGRGDMITFDVPGVSVPSIALTSALPAITTPVEIDGTTQSGGRVEVRGNVLNAIGLDVRGGESTIKGLILHGFEGDVAAGIKLSGGGGNTIVSNWIGVDASGNGVSGNRIGVLIEGSPDNEIGGVGAGEENIIHGLRSAVEISGAASERNKVMGNRVGIGLAGAALEPLSDFGIHLVGGRESQVGGVGSEGNFIATETGVTVAPNDGSIFDSVISGNRMGLNFAGTTSVEGFAGVAAFASAENPIEGLEIIANKIGGTSVGVLAAAVGNHFAGLTIADNEIGLAFNETGSIPEGVSDDLYLFGIRLDGVWRASIQNNIVAAFPWNILVAGQILFFAADEDDDGVPDPDGKVIFQVPETESSEFEPGDTENLSGDVVIDGNTIGLNKAGEVPQGASQSVGITVFGLARNTEIRNNTIAGHSQYEIQLKSGERAELSDNDIGTIDGGALGSRIGVLVEDAQRTVIGPRNTIGQNGVAGISVIGLASGLQIHGNFIGTDPNGALDWPNGVGPLFADNEPDNPLLENLIENNTIARNTGPGIEIQSSEIETRILSNRIYLNGDGDREAGIQYNDEPFSTPENLLVLVSPPNSDGTRTVAFVVSPAGALAEDGGDEPETIIEIFGNPSEDEMQGRTLLVSEVIDPTKPFVATLTVQGDSAFVTSNNYLMTLTRGGLTSEFSGSRMSDPFKLPEIQFEPSESDEIVISWETTNPENLFTVQESRTLSDGDEWDFMAETAVSSGGRTMVILPIIGEQQFFRLTLNPNVFASE
ncbi:MAG: right-handed parallel beta-helix repeat-containing protein [Verrucomicrobiota bacterium]